MRLPSFRLGIVVLLGSVMALGTTGALAQDQAGLAFTANSGMQRMQQSLADALGATNETAAKADVRAAVGAGNEAVAALRELSSVATDDVVRSRAEAALAQTESALAKANAATTETGDTFKGRVEAARAEVAEAVAEFAPVLSIVGQVAAAQALPKSGAGDLTAQGLLFLAGLGTAFAATGLAIRRRSAFAA